MTVAIRIGLLTPQEGPAGLWAPSALACSNLAVTEINTSRGLLGRHVELKVVNTGPSARSAAEAARFAIEVEDVDAIVGMFPSYARGPVARAIGQRVPLIYTPQFEGMERDRNIVTTGETSRELLLPGIKWLIQQKRGQRFFFCGSDYIWPRSTAETAKMIIHDAGGIVTGEAFLPLDCHDYDALLSAIRATRTDVVLPYFLGADAIQFNRTFAEAGLAAKVLRFTSAVDETIIYGLNENATENLFVSSAYFSTLRSRNNGAFLERYHTAYGDRPPPANAFGQSCYEGIHCLASLIEAAGTLDAATVRRALGRTRQCRTARGHEAEPVAGDQPPIHVARVDGYEFTILLSH